MASGTAITLLLSPRICVEMLTSAWGRDALHPDRCVSVVEISTILMKSAVLAKHRNRYSENSYISNRH